MGGGGGGGSKPSLKTSSKHSVNVHWRQKNLLQSFPSNSPVTPPKSSRSHSCPLVCKFRSHNLMATPMDSNVSSTLPKMNLIIIMKQEPSWLTQLSKDYNNAISPLSHWCGGQTQAWRRISPTPVPVTHTHTQTYKSNTCREQDITNLVPVTHTHTQIIHTYNTQVKHRQRDGYHEPQTL